MSEPGDATCTLMQHADRESPAEELTQVWQAASETERGEFLDDLLMETLITETLTDQTRTRRGVRARWTVGLAAAVVLAAAMVLGLVIWGGPRYPRPELTGQFVVATADGREVSAGEMTRGCQVKATGETKLKLAGLYELTLDAGTQIVWDGGPRQEVIGLDAGKLRSVVEPRKGTFTVNTPRGSVKVVGTDFVTEVRNTGQGPVVNVSVTTGTVACTLDHHEESLSAGMSKTFAAGTEPEAKPVEAAKPPERQEGELSGVVVDTDGVKAEEGLVQLKLFITTEKGDEQTFLVGPRNSSAYAMVGGLKPGEKVRLTWTSERSDKKFIRTIRRLEGAK